MPRKLTIPYKPSVPYKRTKSKWPFLKITCPVCGAPPGHLCISHHSNMHRLEGHAVRCAAAREAGYYDYKPTGSGGGGMPHAPRY